MRIYICGRCFWIYRKWSRACPHCRKGVGKAYELTSNGLEIHADEV